MEFSDRHEADNKGGPGKAIRDVRGERLAHQVRSDVRVEDDDFSGPSRAAVVAMAVDRERRRAIAERDAAILAQTASDDDLDELAAYASRLDLSELD